MKAMYASLRSAAVILSVAGLAACAGTTEKSAYVSPGSVGSYHADSDYVSNVERTALNRGVKVTWVNVPVRQVKGDQQL